MENCTPTSSYKRNSNRSKDPPSPMFTRLVNESVADPVTIQACSIKLECHLLESIGLGEGNFIEAADGNCLLKKTLLRNVSRAIQDLDPFFCPRAG